MCIEKKMYLLRRSRDVILFDSFSQRLDFPRKAVTVYSDKLVDSLMRSNEIHSSSQRELKAKICCAVGSLSHLLCECVSVLPHLFIFPFTIDKWEPWFSPSGMSHLASSNLRLFSTLKGEWERLVSTP